MIVPTVEMIPNIGSDIFNIFAKKIVLIPVPMRDVAVKYMMKILNSMVQLSCVRVKRM